MAAKSKIYKFVEKEKVEKIAKELNIKPEQIIYANYGKIRYIEGDYEKIINNWYFSIREDDYTVCKEEGIFRIEKENNADLYYSVNKEGVDKIIKEVTQNIKENWNDELQNNVAKYYVDFPVDFKVVGDFEAFKIKYHPIDRWQGDGWRSGDTMRESVNKEEKKETVEKFDIFISPFNNFLKEAFLKNAELIGKTIIVEEK